MPPYKLFLTVFDACLNGIFRVALKAILGHQAWSWTTLRRGNVFCYVYRRFFYFCHVFTFLTFFYLYLNVFYIYDINNFNPNPKFLIPNCNYTSCNNNHNRNSQPCNSKLYHLPGAAVSDCSFRVGVPRRAGVCGVDVSPGANVRSQRTPGERTCLHRAYPVSSIPRGLI